MPTPHFIPTHSPPWVLPKQDFPISSSWQSVFKRFPFLQRLIRFFLSVVFELLNYSLRSQAFVNLLQWAWGGRRHIKRYVKDPGLLKRLIPNFPIGCKRILQSNNWYKALANPNVEVVPGIAKIEGRQVFASDGSTCEADVIIFGTGFEVASVPVTQHIVGASGKPLSTQWHRPEAYHVARLSECVHGLRTKYLQLLICLCHFGGPTKIHTLSHQDSARPRHCQHCC